MRMARTVKPAASMRERICPVTRFLTASGLMMAKVRSIYPNYYIWPRLRRGGLRRYLVGRASGAADFVLSREVSRRIASQHLEKHRPLRQTGECRLHTWR